MTKVLVDCCPDDTEEGYKIICDRCGYRYGAHYDYYCDSRKIEGQKFAKFQEKESKMKYDKETVVGVL